MKIECGQFTLVDDPLSTDCYSIRLLLAFLQLPYITHYQAVDQSDQHIESPTLLFPEAGADTTITAIMPILNELTALTQTQALWMPTVLSVQIQHWAVFNEKLKLNLGVLRQAYLAADQFLSNESALLQQAQFLLQELEDHLCEQRIRGQAYLLTHPSTQHPTLADLLVFPQVALAWDAGVSLVPFFHIRRWIQRIRHQPHFIAMAGLLEVNQTMA